MNMDKSFLTLFLVAVKLVAARGPDFLHEVFSLNNCDSICGKVRKITQQNHVIKTRDLFFFFG